MNIFSGKSPGNIGVDNWGKLAVCPKKPNCVCSQSTEELHSIPAIKINGTPDEAIARLEKILIEFEGITIISVTEDYLYAECKTPLLGFIDDLEFTLDHEKNIWHVRSASRFGHYDFGKNRNRIEKIRRLLAQNP